MTLERITKCFTYLDNLRESGKTNMYGARPYLEKSMRLESGEAGEVLVKWMRTFAIDKTAKERAKEAMS